MITLFEFDVSQNRTGLTLVELLIGLVLTGIIMGFGYQTFKRITQTSTRQIKDTKVDLDVKRFVSVVTEDIERAGSDPTGRALYAYIKFNDCGPTASNTENQAPHQIVYGINPAPANKDCTEQIGDFGLLSYLPFDEDPAAGGDANKEIGPEEGLAFDANNDGVVEPYEGLGNSLESPLLRPSQDDYIVYDYYDSDSDGIDDTISRINAGNAFDDDDNTSFDVLNQVADFNVRYFGIVAGNEGEYGEISDLEFFDNMREVQVDLHVYYGSAESGYENAAFDASHPYRNYRTHRYTFRVGVNVIKPES